MWTEKRRIATRGGEVALVERGNADAPPVVLLHGLGTSSFEWRHLVALLSTSMHVVAPDLLGHGDSGPARHHGVEAHAATIADVVDELGLERVAIVGHGLGGAIAQSLWPRAAALILMGSLAFDASATLPSQTDGEAWVRALFDLGMSHRERLSDADLDEYVRPFRERSAPRATVESVQAPLGDLEIPAIVLWGEDDRVVDVAMAERIGDALPRATIALLPGCGHFLLEDAAETVAPLVFQWLRSQYLQIEHRHEAGPVVVELGRPSAGEDR